MNWEGRTPPHPQSPDSSHTVLNGGTYLPFLAYWNLYAENHEDNTPIDQVLNRERSNIASRQHLSRKHFCCILVVL